MTDRVTVVTPTMPRRHEKLLRACQSVREQTLRDWVHMIIPNGYDDRLYGELIRGGHQGQRVRVVPLGRPHPTPGHWNRVLAGLLAETPYIAYLDDDNYWRPRHLELLVGALERNPSAGFAYAQANHVLGLLGDDQLAAGRAVNHIDASMIVHRVELFTEYATWDPHQAKGNNYAMDGLLVDYWLRQGVTYEFVPEVTLEYPEVGYWKDGGGAELAEVTV